jgi:hypothetical protein
MRFFAIALVPGGNILAQVSALKNKSPAILGPSEGLALPEGIYIGFFDAGAPASRKELLRRFKNEAQVLFSGLPERLRFGLIRNVGKSSYLVPLEGLPGGPAKNAMLLGAQAGLKEYADPPICPGIGFFMGNYVTPEPVEAFSFSNLQVLLLEVDSPSVSWDCAAWKLLHRAARIRGSRGDKEMPGEPGS